MREKQTTKNQPGQATTIFAGGCFWCMEPPFEKLDGVSDVVSGYTGGTGENPTYGDYAKKGHVEAVQIRYDPARVSYRQLLDVFWRQIDPTDSGGQFVDRGPEYRPVIYYQDDAQRQEAEESRRQLEDSGRYLKPVTTEILPAVKFYPAEDYHQDYYKTHPYQYKFYRFNAGRDQYLKKIWGQDPGKAPPLSRAGKYQRPPAEELKRKLNPLQYKVTQQDGTEPPFKNPYWNNKAEGIYVDIVSGEPLFSSKDKYDSGTGWPSFTRPLAPENIVEKEDRSLFGTRTEVRSRGAGSHLGHVFPDGPQPTGQRYCINSAALSFIPKEELEQKGYGAYEGYFAD